MDVVLVEHGQAPVLGDPLHVVVVGGLVDERPDREARDGHDAQNEQRRNLHRHKRAPGFQRSRNSRTDSAIQSIISPLRPG
jgi:hypothetical protein